MLNALGTQNDALHVVQVFRPEGFISVLSYRLFLHHPLTSKEMSYISSSAHFLIGTAQRLEIAVTPTKQTSATHSNRDTLAYLDMGRVSRVTSLPPAVLAHV
jgi:hypothetical protein